MKILIIICLLLDRWFKKLVFSKSFFTASKILKFQLVKNSKLFSLNIDQEILILISLVVLAIILVSLIKVKNNRIRTGLLFVITGGLSNLFDRLIYGYVIDYFWVCVSPFFYFNLADLLIISGCLLIFFEEMPKKKASPKDKVKSTGKLLNH